MADPSHSLRALFHPRSVAVIGASSDPHKIGGRTFRYIRDHWKDGPLYPVNDRYPEVQGVPTLPRVQDLPHGVELAILVVPASAAARSPFRGRPRSARQRGSRTQCALRGRTGR